VPRGGLHETDQQGGSFGIRSHGGEHRGPPGQRRSPGAFARYRACAGKCCGTGAGPGACGPCRAQPAGGAGARRPCRAEARSALPCRLRCQHRSGKPGGRPGAAWGVRLGDRGGAGKPGGEKTPLCREGGAQPEGGDHPQQQHERPVGERPGRGAPRPGAPQLPGDPLLQPAALHAAHGDGPLPGNGSRAHRLPGPIPGRETGEGRGLCEGHPQLHRQPDRHLRRRNNRSPHGRDGAQRRGGGCHHRSRAGAPQDRDLRALGPGGDRHGSPGARQQLRGAARGRRARGIPGSREHLEDGRRWPDREKGGPGVLQAGDR